MHQHVQDIGGDKGRQARTQADVLDAQVQERQKNSHRLLFIPGTDDGQRQVVHLHAEGVGQRRSDLHRGIGVVALAHVQQTGNAADVAQVFVEEPKLAAGQGEDHGVLRRLFHELGVVTPPRLGAVAAAHQEEVLDGPGLHRVDDLVGHAHDGVAGEAHHDGFTFAVFLKSRHFQGFLDHRGEIQVRDMFDTGPAHQPPGENPVDIVIFGLLDAVGGHDNGTGELGKFLDLVLPGGAEMPVKMGVFLQARIAVAGQHLAVGVHVNALAFALLEDFLQVQQIVAGDQDGLALFVAQGNGGGHRMAVAAGIAGVQKLHGPKIDLAALEDHGDKIGNVQVRVRGRGQGFVNEGVNLLILLAQNPGMIGVGAHALDSKEQNVLQRQGVGVGRRVRFEAVLLALGHQLLHTALGLISGRPLGEVGPASCGLDFALELFPELGAAVDQGDKTLGVEIHVGEGGEAGLTGENIDVFVAHSNLPARHGHLGQPLQGVNEKVLQRRHLGIFATHSQDSAAFALGCLLTLVTKHAHILLAVDWITLGSRRRLGPVGVTAS